LLVPVTPARAMVPSGVDVEVHTALPVSGPQTKKLTVPCGWPPAAVPATVAVSVTVPLADRVTAPLPLADADCCVVVLDDKVLTLKHSSVVELSELPW
jgi:hypothetical protein